jgi:ATP-dependent protease ClpP protease subunit
MRAELKAIAEIKADKIIVNIDSPGGSVWHGMSIHDLLAQHKAVKETRIIGMAASIASVIAQCGQTRKISDNALFLAHRSMGIAIGNQNEISALVDSLKSIDDKIIGIYTKRGANAEKINELMNADNGNGKWIDGEEAKEYGLIDEVFEPTKAAAIYDKSILNKLKYPVIPEKMTQKAEETRNLFNKMKDAFNAVFKAANKDAEIPKDVTDKLNEFDNKLKDLEAENTTLTDQLKTKTDDITAKDLKITELTGQVATAKTASDKAIADANAEKELATKDKNETLALKKELTDLKNEWIPAGRIKGANSTDPTAVNKNDVKETIKKSKTPK